MVGSKLNIKQTNIKLDSVSGFKIKPVGVISMNFLFNNCIYCEKFDIVHNDVKPKYDIELKLKLKANTNPVAKPLHRVPLSLKERLKTLLMI